MRLNDHQLVQRVEWPGGATLVVLDETTGEEVEFTRQNLALLRHAIGTLFPWDTQYLDEDSLEDFLEVPEDWDERYPAVEWIAG